MKSHLRRYKFVYLSCIAIITILVVIICTFFVKDNLEKETFKDYKFYKYFLNNKFEYNGTITINNNKDVTNLSINGKKISLDSIPLYVEGKEELLLPKNMSINIPHNGFQQSKINYFSKLYIKDDIVYLQDGKLKKPIDNCFLYDSEDLYVFVDNVIVTVNENDYNLSPLSYISVLSKNLIEIFNYKSQKYDMIELDENNVVVNGTNYSIDTYYDTVSMGDVSMLLVKNLELLSNYK